MKGIYVHIPYCKKKCSYCNFYFTVSGKTKKSFVEALLLEIEETKDYFKEKDINSLYFGGGTPSQLDISDLEKIMTKLNDYYEFKENIEITLEANPDDLDKLYIENISKIGINRVSLGVQSFNDYDLETFGRTHNSETAIEAIKACKKNGINNLTIDLIFGTPGSGINEWIDNLHKFVELEIDHLSCYNLTIEPKTEIYHKIKNKKASAVDEKLSTELFLLTIDHLQKKGYEHYEISNFARNKKYAKHNTNYWKGGQYLGLGPSAHSYNGVKRHWNISNTRKYIDSLREGKPSIEEEILTYTDKYNEYIMTGLRTMWGVSLKTIEQDYNKFKSHFLKNIEVYIAQNKVFEKNGIYLLSDQGKLFADRIASDLFFDS